MTFNTYYWANAALGGPELAAARETLARSDDGDARARAFETLLRSGSRAAIAVALDHYDHAETSSRHGSDNEFASFAAEVLERARELLRRPASTAVESGADEDGADHASALGVMLNLATAEDSPLIAAAIEQAPSVSVSSAGLAAAATALERSEHPDENLMALLDRIVAERGRRSSERVAALRAIASARSPATVELLVRATASDDLQVQVHATLLLALDHLESHRDLIENRVRTWPPDPPYPADEVVDLLADDDTELGES